MKMIKCKTCGADIAASAKTCPQCGARVIHPVAGIVAAIVCVVALFVVLPQASTKTHKNEPDAPQTQEPLVKVSAVDLWKAYNDNKVNADGLYKDKKVAVSGTIIDIGQDIITKAPCISLDTGGSVCLYPIQCFFPKNGDQTKLIATLSDGDLITIYGICDGVPIASVQLSNCYF